MSVPKWTAKLLTRLAPSGRVGDILGDLEEAHRRRLQHQRRWIAAILTQLEALDVAFALLRGRAARRSRFGNDQRTEARPMAIRRWRPGVSWLDFKLGFRMLVKHPALTLVGGLAMAFAIWIGAGTFEFVTQIVSPTLPLPDGDRIVGLTNWDAASGGVERRVLRDFAVWRQELESVVDLGAFRTVQRNLVTAEGAGEPVEAAEISASAFRVARVPPLLGRFFVEEDELPGAPPVVVIGYDVWEARFGRDADVIGRTVRVGSEPVTVIGVMPEGFAFPVSHDLWIPFRTNVLEHGWRDGPALQVFGRLVPGVSLADAQAELRAMGRRAASDSPDTHEHLRPQVMPHARSILGLNFFGGDLSRPSTWTLVSSLMMLVNLPAVLFLVLVCGNVALLMFARAATRESEIVVRNALGASRGRIIVQLFVEALVLGSVATALGLAGASFGLKWAYGTVIADLLQEDLPFWFEPSLGRTTIVYTLVLTVLGALIAGAVPALKVTREMGTRLRQATAGGGGFRFGGIWTAVIVGQVAITMPFPMIVLSVRGEAAAIRAVDVGFPEENYLSARLGLDREALADASADTSREAFAARLRATLLELERRLMAEPAVMGVTFADLLPRMYHPHRLIEVDEGGAAPLDEQWGPGYRVSSASVAIDYFDVLGVPIHAGRGFHSGDLESEARVVIVNESFVERVLGGRNPIGRRVRYKRFEEGKRDAPDDEPWHEIVGVVRDLGFSYGDFDPKIAGFYHPVPPGDAYRMAIHVNGDAASFAPRLRGLAAAVDPNLRLHALMPLDEVTASELEFYGFWFRLLVLGTSIALLLALAGIYAVMSFTVSQRKREIGIRVALGADRRRVVAAIFRRPIMQVGLGALAGALLIASLLLASGITVSLRNAAVFLVYMTLMTGVCLLACIVPTRRALSVEPTEALKDDG